MAEKKSFPALEKGDWGSVRVPEGRRKGAAEESLPVTLRQKHLPTAH